jgi:hypothetical protein
VIGILTDRYQLIANRLTPIFQLLRPIRGLRSCRSSFFGSEYSGACSSSSGSQHLGVPQVDPMMIRAARSLGRRSAD